MDEVVTRTHQHLAAAANAAEMAENCAERHTLNQEAKSLAYASLAHSNRCAVIYIKMVALKNTTMERIEERKAELEDYDNVAWMDANKAHFELSQMESWERRIIASRVGAEDSRDNCINATREEEEGEQYLAA